PAAPVHGCRIFRSGCDDGHDRQRPQIPTRRGEERQSRGHRPVDLPKPGDGEAVQDDLARGTVADGNKPLAFTTEEQARIDLAKIEYVDAQMARQMRVMGLGERQAALRSGLTAASKTQRDVALFLIKLAEAGEDCRLKLEAVRKLIEN